jgi:hypothetical protein
VTAEKDRDRDLGDDGESFRSEHSAGLRHADDDPAFGDASGNAIASLLPEGFVNVGMDVKVHHLAAT